METILFPKDSAPVSSETDSLEAPAAETSIVSMATERAVMCALFIFYILYTWGQSSLQATICHIGCPTCSTLPMFLVSDSREPAVLYISLARV